MKFNFKTGEFDTGYRRAFCSFDGDEPAGNTVTTTNQDPWSKAQPYLETGFEQAGEQLETPLEYFGGSTVVPFSEQTEAALQAQEGRAAGGSPLLSAAQGEAQKTLGGEYLEAGNPAFGAMAERISNQVRPRVDTQFAGSGRYGGAGHQEQMGRVMADAMAPLAWQNYSAERGNMMDMTQAAPGLAREDYFDIGQLGQVGAQREGQAGRELSEEIDRFNFGQYEPRDRLANYMALIGGGRQGATTTRSQPYFTNTAGNAIGAASGIAGLLGNLGWQPFS